MNLSPKLTQFLHSQINKNDTVLDVGCGDKWYHKYLPKCSVITVDVFEKFDPDYLLDLEEDDLPEVQADVCLLVDVIEHLEKERGLEILEQAKKLAKKVIIVTPLIWNKNEAVIKDKSSSHFGNKHDLHKSLWSPEDFEGAKQYKLWPRANRYAGVIDV